MSRIKIFFHTYVCVVAGVILATAVFITLFMPEVELDVNILWQIMFVSFLCSLGELMYSEKRIDERKRRLLVFLHYVEVNAVVLGFGMYFHWFSIQYLPHVIVMLLIINIIFLCVSMIEWRRAKEMAGLMNRRLAENRKEDIEL